MNTRTRKTGLAMVAGLVFLLVLVHVSLVTFDEAGRNGTLIGVACGLVNLVVGAALTKRSLSRGGNAAMSSLVGGFFARLAVLVVGVLWFQKTAAVDATAFAIAFLTLFFVYLAVEIVLVERMLAAGRGRTA